MLSEGLRALIRCKYLELGSYRKVRQACNVSPNIVRALILDLHIKDKATPGPRKILTKRDVNRIKRKTGSLIASGHKVTSRKIRAQ